MLRGRESESEDCLFLNVWTEAVTPVTPRPVMVWLHGGGFNYGSAGAPTYDGSFLARTRDVVVVSLNHRLGSLGFVNPQLLARGRSEVTPNAGVLDIVAALTWVRDNIAAFGGDPSRVLIFCQSGGGWKVSALLATPAAQGLFHRAVIQSGPGARMTDEPYGAMIAERFAAALAEIGERDPMSAPVEAILTAQAIVEAGLGVRLIPNLISGFAPICDGTVLPSHPFTPYASPCSRHVPLIIGRTATEMTLFSDEATLGLSTEEVPTRLEPFGEEAAAMLSIRRGRAPYESPASTYQHVLADITMLPFTSAIAKRRLAAAHASTYMYRVDFETPVHEGRLHAPHCIELPHVFGTLDTGRALVGWGPRNERLANVMSFAWSSFAHDGSPALPDEEPAWPEWTPDRAPVFVFDERCFVDECDRAAEIELATAINSRLFSGDATGAFGGVPEAEGSALAL